MELLESIVSEVDEVIGIKNIIDIVGKKRLEIYWGSTPTRIPNINYLIPLLTISHFIKHNCKIKILLA